MVWSAIQQARGHWVQAASATELGQAEAGLGTGKIWLPYTRFVQHAYNHFLQVQPLQT